MLQKSLRIAQPLFFAAAVLAIALFLRSQWRDLAAFTWRLDPAWLAGATALLLLTWAVEVGIWHRILSLVGGRLPYFAAMRIWFLSAVMRYIPGNIWQPLSMTVYCAPARRAPRGNADQHRAVPGDYPVGRRCPLPRSILLVAGMPPALAGTLSAFTPLLIALLLLPALVFVAKPGWLSAALNAILVKLGRRPLEARLSAAAMLGLLAAALFDWLLWGATFAAFTFAIADIAEIATPQPARLVLLLIVSYPIAYAVGFLSFFTPSGFGVREGAFFLLLGPHPRRQRRHRRRPGHAPLHHYRRAAPGCRCRAPSSAAACALAAGPLRTQT